MTKVTNHTGILKKKAQPTKRLLAHNEKSNSTQLTKQEKEDLILSLAGNVEWEGKLATKRKSRFCHIHEN